MKSILAMTEFISQNNLRTDSYGNCEFEGFINYKSKIRNAFEKTTVKFIRNGYHGGNIQLMESGELIPDNFHLDLSRDYQAYEYNTSDNALIIWGKSQKMSGRYQIVITL
ncbi:hypothetical protein [Zophobihabitans entericus]|uniref:Uncharacterized protein n=1 Tax=Zophobihabitans entericus TaxID=1635327 RepID=A0A6G9I8T9_9GAMM|nr:hypothetical protein [Zophobihabitans entericus]QIQ20242.1 hypothetical protein IPMB12_00225 [Zophobihabitans entericus]